MEVPALGPVGMARWAWRQLTKMSTALVLLLLLAIAAVPGSLFPQRVQDPGAVADYIKANPVMGPWLDRFQLFDVFSSYWFSAIYLLLFISLVGCVIPRALQHFKAWRSKPPRTPRRISRLPQYRRVMLGGRDGAEAPTPDNAIEQAAAALKKRGYRVQVQDLGTGAPSVAAERGMLKEVGTSRRGAPSRRALRAGSRGCPSTAGSCWAGVTAPRHPPRTTRSSRLRPP